MAARNWASMAGASSRKVSTSSAANSSPTLRRSSANVGRSITERCTSGPLAWLHGVERSDEGFDTDRFGEVVVHPRGQAHLAVTLHRVGGHGDDARPFVRPHADDPAGGLQAVHLWHLHVHEDDVVLLAYYRLDRLQTVRGEVGAV